MIEYNHKERHHKHESSHRYHVASSVQTFVPYVQEAYCTRAIFCLCFWIISINKWKMYGFTIIPSLYFSQPTRGMLAQMTDIRMHNVVTTFDLLLKFIKRWRLGLWCLKQVKSIWAKVLKLMIWNLIDYLITVFIKW